MNLMMAILAGSCAATGAVPLRQEAFEQSGARFLPVSVADDLERPRAPPPGGPEGRDPEEVAPRFSLGPAAGYLRARDADRGTWFGGLQVRARLAPVLAVEGSITFHQDEFLDGDVEVTRYPVQVTALLYPLGDGPLRPYGLAGAGWYSTRYEYGGLLSPFEDESDRSFGFHAGAGLEIGLGPSASIFADFRWIFLDEPGVDNSRLEDEEFDYGQVALGLSLQF